MQARRAGPLAEPPAPPLTCGGSRRILEGRHVPPSDSEVACSIDRKRRKPGEPLEIACSINRTATAAKPDEIVVTEAMAAAGQSALALVRADDEPIAIFGAIFQAMAAESPQMRQFLAEAHAGDEEAAAAIGELVADTVKRRRAARGRDRRERREADGLERRILKRLRGIGWPGAAPDIDAGRDGERLSAASRDIESRV